MAINQWWSGRPEERYWLEINTRDDVGEQLISPQHGANDSTPWTYELMSCVREGDIVLHYRAPYIVGYSIAAADVTAVPEFTWAARGTYARERGGEAETGPGWFVPLRDYTEYPEPLDMVDLEEEREALLALRDTMRAQHASPKGSIYFPWTPYRDALRTQQGYLVKVPAATFDLFPTLRPSLGSAEVTDPPEFEVEEEQATASGRKTTRRPTRIQDPKLRKAIEQHAVDMAIAHYLAQGGTNPIELGKPYDVRITLDGVDRHVEVKGSSMTIEKVQLTINEVDHARGYQPTDLVVVDEIEWLRGPDGDITTSGGRVRIWSDWSPEDYALRAMAFSYELPADLQRAVLGADMC